SASCRSIRASARPSATGSTLSNRCFARANGATPRWPMPMRRSAASENFLAAHRERYEKHRDKLGPNIIANVEQGLKMSLADAARGQVLATKIYRAFQEFFRDVDILICPT